MPEVAYQPDTPLLHKRQPSGPIPGFIARPLKPLLILAENAYKREVACRNARFDDGKGVVTLDRPVISVGNISVGGTGKTPLVTQITQWLLDAGRSPAIAMRGYKAPPGQRSDEAAAYDRRFDNAVPVVAQPNRVEGLIDLFATEAGERTDTIILDDGFQHRRLARDLDLVLIDVSRDFFNLGCLPRGWLREPQTAVQRADAVILTHADLVEPTELTRFYRRLIPILGADATGKPKPVFATSHAWESLEVQHPNGDTTTEPVEWLRDKTHMPVCAIGSPHPFVNACIRATGNEPAAAVTLRDHDPYRPATMSRILRLAEATNPDAVIVTDKDWTKLAKIKPEAWARPVVRPKLQIHFHPASDAPIGISDQSILQNLILNLPSP